MKDLNLELKKLYCGKNITETQAWDRRKVIVNYILCFENNTNSKNIDIDDYNSLRNELYKLDAILL